MRIEKIDNNTIKIIYERVEIVRISELKKQLEDLKDKEAEYKRIEELIPVEIAGSVMPFTDSVDPIEIQKLDEKIKEYEKI